MPHTKTTPPTTTLLVYNKAQHPRLMRQFRCTPHPSQVWLSESFWRTTHEVKCAAPAPIVETRTHKATRIHLSSGTFIGRQARRAGHILCHTSPAQWTLVPIPRPTSPWRPPQTKAAPLPPHWRAKHQPSRHHSILQRFARFVAASGHR
jgi:hypothetical protein